MTRSRDREIALARPGGILTTVRSARAERPGMDGLFLTVVGPEGFTAVTLPQKGVSADRPRR